MVGINYPVLSEVEAKTLIQGCPSPLVRMTKNVASGIVKFLPGCSGMAGMIDPDPRGQLPVADQFLAGYIGGSSGNKDEGTALVN